MGEKLPERSLVTMSKFVVEGNEDEGVLLGNI